MKHDTRNDRSVSHPPPRRAAWTVLALLAVVQVTLLVYSALVHSANVDEVGHFAAGFYQWKTRQFDVYRVNPPLVRAVAAVPAVMMLPNQETTSFDSGPLSRPEWVLGRGLFEQNPRVATRALEIGRCLCIPCMLVGMFVCFRWANDLFGRPAGLIASLLWCFSPNLLAHGCLITPDAASTSLGVAACYVFWKWVREPRMWPGVFCGALLGLTLLTKFTWIILFGVWTLLWAVHVLRRQAYRAIAVEAMKLCVLFATAVYVVNVGYLFERTFVPLGDYTFVSRALSGSPATVPVPGNRFKSSWLGRLPVPFPANVVSGIDVQKRDFDIGMRSYLRGEWRDGGWWYYYLYAFLLKTPLSIWFLLLLAMVGVIRWRAQFAAFDLAALGVVPVTLVLIVSAQTGFNHHLRYILQAFPFVFIFAAGAVVAARNVSNQRRATWLRGGIAAACTWFVISSLQVFPHSMSYFNELVGGPREGHRHLVDSNIDWGQDVKYLRRYLAAHPASQPLYLAYFGGLDPRLYGIEYALPPRAASLEQRSMGLPPGTYAVSVNLLRGLHFRVPNGKGALEHAGDDAFAYFQQWELVARAGYSINIYRVAPAPDVER